MKLDAAAFVGEDALVNALGQYATSLDCGDGRILFQQGDPANGLYIVHEGEVCMRMVTPDGEQVMDIPALPGSLLGLPALVGGAGYSLSARAKKGARVSFVSREAFSQLMLQEPPIAMMILKVLAKQVATARIVAANLKAREAHALQELEARSH